MIDTLFPTPERAMSAARRFLCTREEKSELVEEFRREVRALAVEPERIDETIARHFEELQNRARIPKAHVPAEMARLGASARGYAERMRGVLRSTYSPEPHFSEIENARRQKLVAAIGG